MGARQTKIAYENSDMVKKLHGLVFENNFFFFSFSWVTFKWVSFFFSFSFFLNVSGLIHMQGCFRSQRGQVPPLAPSGSALGCQYRAFVSIELRWRTRVSKTLYSSSSSFAFDFQWLGDVVPEPLVFFFFFLLVITIFFKLRN